MTLLGNLRNRFLSTLSEEYLDLADLILFRLAKLLYTKGVSGKSILTRDAFAKSSDVGYNSWFEGRYVTVLNSIPYKEFQSKFVVDGSSVAEKYLIGRDVLIDVDTARIICEEFGEDTLIDIGQDYSFIFNQRLQEITCSILSVLDYAVSCGGDLKKNLLYYWCELVDGSSPIGEDDYAVASIYPQGPNGTPIDFFHFIYGTRQGNSYVVRTYQDPFPAEVFIRTYYIGNKTVTMYANRNPYSYPLRDWVSGIAPVTEATYVTFSQAVDTFLDTNRLLAQGWYVKAQVYLEDLNGVEIPNSRFTIPIPGFYYGNLNSSFMQMIAGLLQDFVIPNTLLNYTIAFNKFCTVHIVSTLTQDEKPRFILNDSDVYTGQTPYNNHMEFDRLWGELVVPDLTDPIQSITLFTYTGLLGQGIGLIGGYDVDKDSDPSDPDSHGYLSVEIVDGVYNQIAVGINSNLPRFVPTGKTYTVINFDFRPLSGAAHQLLKIFDVIFTNYFIDDAAGISPVTVRLVGKWNVIVDTFNQLSTEGKVFGTLRFLESKLIGSKTHYYYVVESDTSTYPNSYHNMPILGFTTHTDAIDIAEGPQWHQYMMTLKVGTSQTTAGENLNLTLADADNPYPVSYVGDGTIMYINGSNWFRKDSFYGVKFNYNWKPQIDPTSSGEPSHVMVLGGCIQWNVQIRCVGSSYVSDSIGESRVLDEGFHVEQDNSSSDFGILKVELYTESGWKDISSEPSSFEYQQGRDTPSTINLMDFWDAEHNRYFDLYEPQSPWYTSSYFTDLPLDTSREGVFSSWTPGHNQLNKGYRIYVPGGYYSEDGDFQAETSFYDFLLRRASINQAMPYRALMIVLRYNTSFGVPTSIISYEHPTPHSITGKMIWDGYSTDFFILRIPSDDSDTSRHVEYTQGVSTHVEYYLKCTYQVLVSNEEAVTVYDEFGNSATAYPIYMGRRTSINPNRPSSSQTVTTQNYDSCFAMNPLQLEPDNRPVKFDDVSVDYFRENYTTGFTDRIESHNKDTFFFNGNSNSNAESQSVDELQYTPPAVKEDIRQVSEDKASVTVISDEQNNDIQKQVSPIKWTNPSKFKLEAEAHIKLPNGDVETIDLGDVSPSDLAGLGLYEDEQDVVLIFTGHLNGRKCDLNSIEVLDDQGGSTVQVDEIDHNNAVCHVNENTFIRLNVFSWAQVKVFVEGNGTLIPDKMWSKDGTLIKFAVLPDDGYHYNEIRVEQDNEITTIKSSSKAEYVSKNDQNIEVYITFEKDV